MNKFLFIALLLPLIAVAQGREVEITFQLSENPPDDTLTVSKLKLYATNLQVTLADGTQYSEPNSYHLLDLLDSTRNTIRIQISSNQGLSQLGFTVGTDSLTNVSGVYDGDLDPIQGMYWAWNSGYINFKMEGSYKNTDFEFHVGGYTGKTATARSLQLSLPKNQNTYTIELNPVKILEHVDLKSHAMILIPGVEASAIADQFSEAFSVKSDE